MGSPSFHFGVNLCRSDKNLKGRSGGLDLVAVYLL